MPAPKIKPAAANSQPPQERAAALGGAAELRV
jgi:hypothetical protein